MIRRTRRTVLYGLGGGSVAALAGCTTEGDPGSGDGTDGSDGGDVGDGSDGAPETEVQQVGAALSGPAWDRESRRGFCTLFTDEDEIRWLFDDASAEVGEFVEATDFSSSVLAYVESVGPTTCYSQITFADIGVEDGTLVASATVESTAADDELCGEAITYSAALLRVTADPLPDSLRLSVTNGWGETAELTGDEGIRDPDALDGFGRPDGDPRTVPAALDCEDDSFERHPAAYSEGVSWESGGRVGDNGDGALELRVVNPAYDGDDPAEALTFERGDDVRIELTNVSNREVSVGNHGKYNVEVLTEEGWTDVRGGDDGQFDYTDEAIAHPPGETVVWEFTMTESGLVAEENQPDGLRVCPDLRPGRYRFVFFGAADIAVAFDYVG
ncbi:cupredoxin domain-containing protein [Halorubrum lacusprofundi]|jgi:hypothetical protein|uniref:Uncharacterized protein n=1 Tax=Halorubrum lacusprofundi (strain ATCC 49239 / DSM 5036 / JCM 8891 / ACAM 34) TaxID=416348 RepID=B9LRX3_HALLT|nr:hypothetical protein [Halorubrum lacusprofundi]ACM57847.1 conserved hypothetical protein [Halorubrum lacusprofundi ATCC 49239]MCG1007000.1 hypothetical protein [Halorubrum lacusprofundi]